ncbi:carboxymuconolactone decarboxylase family protein [Staphylococcus simulans]
MKSRFELGLDHLNHIDGEVGKQVVNSFHGDSRDIGKYIVEFAFGDIYNRGVLDYKQRELITISSLASIGSVEAQLEVHIKAALNVGIKPKEIIETFIHLIPYVGFPKVINSIKLTDKVLEDEKRNRQ